HRLPSRGGEIVRVVEPGAGDTERPAGQSRIVEQAQPDRDRAPREDLESLARLARQEEPFSRERLVAAARRSDAAHLGPLECRIVERAVGTEDDVDRSARVRDEGLLATADAAARRVRAQAID